MATSSVFTGNSRFSNDFSQVIDRSVAIASLPLKLLQQQKSKLDAQAAALTTLNSKAGTLQASVESLQKAFGAASFGVSVSDEAAIRATATDAAVPGSWNLSVSSLGSATTFVVSGFPAVQDPSTGTYVSGNSQSILVDIDPTDGLNNPEVITLQPAGQNLRAVVDEINAKGGTKVQASIVNLGTTSAPNFQLSLQSRMLGGADITFVDGATQSTNSNAQRGALAAYTVNGANVTTDSRTVTLAPGVTVDLKGTSATPVSVSVNRSTSALSTALTNFVAAYNSTNAEISSHRGNKNAALSGNSVLFSASDSLRSLVSASSPSGGFNSLSDLGIGFDSDGQLYLDQDRFGKATAGKLDQVKTFLGTTDGTGLLSKLTGVMNGLTKNGVGLLSTAISTVQQSSKLEAEHISDQQDRIDRLQTDLQARMAAADAAIAALEQQVSYLTGMFTAMRSNSENNR